MFEFLMLAVFFGAALWFILPERQSTPSRRVGCTQRQQPGRTANRPLPREGAEQWFHSGRN